MSYEVVLAGCAPTPLAHYLKALGILRLVGEQADQSAAGCWKGESFVLRSSLDRDRLVRFLLHEYRPAPIVAPWNGGSGFFPKDNREALDRIAKSRSARFNEMREAIEFGKKIVKRERLTASPKNEVKTKFILTVRANAPEPLLAWLDAAILLTTEDLRYPPLLGTGGNDGRLDFTNNFMQRLVEVLDVSADAPTDEGRACLPSALYGEPVAGLTSAAVGQFNPGSVGGPNAGTGFEAGSLINPWDFILMLEGALVFAAAVTRRLESGESGTLSYPFTVRAVGSGNGGTSIKDEAPARAEIWLPLWDRFATLPEIKALFSEGRATLGRRPVKDGLDFARAVAALGVDRGILAFQRYGFLMRSGKAYLATPLSRFSVRRNRDADLIADLEQLSFLDRLRRFARDENAPGRIIALTRRLEDALFDLAGQFNRFRLQSVLMLLGELEASLAGSRRARDAGVPPVPPLSDRWVVKADDESAEFRIALALASMTLAGVPMRLLVAPVRANKTGWGWEWDDESRTAAWTRGSLIRNLGELLERQLYEWSRETKDEMFRDGVQISSSDLAALLSAATDDTRVARLFAGLALCRVPDRPRRLLDQENAPPAAFAVLKPFFTSEALLRRWRLLPPDETRRLVLPREVPRLLRAGRVHDAVKIGWRRLRVAGVSLPGFPSEAPCGRSLDGPRLLAALVVPLDADVLIKALRRIAEPVSQTIDTKGGNA